MTISGAVALPDLTPPAIRIDTFEANVWRVEPDGSRVAVRAQGDGSGAIYDYECPQGVTVHYEDWTGDVSPDVEMPDVGAWLIPPANPAMAVALDLISDGSPGWSWPIEQSVVDIPGAGAVSVTFGRKARRGELKVLGGSVDDDAALSAILALGGPFLLSVPPRLWTIYGRASWVSIGDVEERARDADPDAVWVRSLPVIAVSRPERVEDLTLSWDDIATQWGNLAATWDTIERGV